MKKILDPIVNSAEDAADFAKRMTEEGLTFIQTTLGKLPLISSVIVSEDDTLKDRDETHYFLVPHPEHGFVMYSARRLPKGYVTENDLPKARIFHLPGPGSESKLEELVADNIRVSKGGISEDVPLADRLEFIGEEIDEQSNKVTGGLVLIGGVVALANPLLGIGIAAKALLPCIGSKLAREGLSMAGGKIREMTKISRRKSVEKEVKAEVKALKPEAVINPALQAIGDTINSDYDPIGFSLSSFAVEGDPRPDLLIMTAEAVSTVYDGDTGNKRLDGFVTVLRGFQDV